jgi:hypothetical protein
MTAPTGPRRWSLVSRWFSPAISPPAQYPAFESDPRKPGVRRGGDTSDKPAPLHISVQENGFGLEGSFHLASRRTLCSGGRDEKTNKAASYNRARRVKHEPRPWAECGKWFVPGRSDAKLCSDLCRWRRSRRGRNAARRDRRRIPAQGGPVFNR